jgi:hypothetical protein
MRLLASRDVSPPFPRLRVRNLVVCALLALAAWSALPALPARADYRDLIVDACGRDPATGVADERVTGTYSQKDYREALRNLSDDQLQYTDCEAIIRAAQLAGARAEAGGGKSSAPGVDALIAGAGGDPLASATPQERAAVEQAVKQAESSGGTPLNVGGTLVSPSSLGSGRTVAGTASDLPTPLLIALIVAALAAFGALVSQIADRVRAARKP